MVVLVIAGGGHSTGKGGGRIFSEHNKHYEGDMVRPIVWLLLGKLKCLCSFL